MQVQGCLYCSSCNKNSLKLQMSTTHCSHVFPPSPLPIHPFAHRHSVSFVLNALSAFTLNVNMNPTHTSSLPLLRLMTFDVTITTLYPTAALL